MSQNNLNAVHDFYGAIARGDFAHSMLDPQIEWIEPHVPDLWFSGTHHSPAEVLSEVIEPTFENFDDFRVECEEFLDAGDRVIVTGHFSGRAKDTGIALYAPFAHIWTLRGDKAVRFQSFTDTANWLYALYRIQVEHPTGV